jgi:hypothetical protein
MSNMTIQFAVSLSVQTIKMVSLKFMRKAVIFFKDDSFEGVVLTCYQCTALLGLKMHLITMP